MPPNHPAQSVEFGDPARVKDPRALALVRSLRPGYRVIADHDVDQNESVIEHTEGGEWQIVEWRPPHVPESAGGKQTRSRTKDGTQRRKRRDVGKRLAPQAAQMTPSHSLVVRTSWRSDGHAAQYRSVLPTEHPCVALHPAGETRTWPSCGTSLSRNLGIQAMATFIA